MQMIAQAWSSALIDMDDLDRRILRALQNNNRLSFAEMADVVGSSAASCLRRVKRLRAAKAILADVCILSPEISEQNLIVIVNVELERERLDLVDEFKKAMKLAEEVTQCYMVTGDSDFVLIVSVKDIAAFDHFVKTKLYSNPNVRKFRSMINIDRVKFETKINI